MKPEFQLMIETLIQSNRDSLNSLNTAEGAARIAHLCAMSKNFSHLRSYSAPQKKAIFEIFAQLCELTGIISKMNDQAIMPLLQSQRKLSRYSLYHDLFHQFQCYAVPKNINNSDELSPLDKAMFY